MSLVVRSDADRGLPPVLRETLRSLGWAEFDEEAPPESQRPANLWWRTNRFTASQITSAKYPYQRINHYPKSSEITKKDSLARHLKRMRTVHGPVYDYMPITFSVPNEYVTFCKFFSAEQAKADEAGTPPPTYIAKPSDMSRGRKIFVFRAVHELSYDCPTVVCKYVDRPLLIHGHKVDFRIYCLVTCFQPLRAYLYDEGLARFGVEKYVPDDVTNLFSHLTNYSINKNSDKYDDFKPGIGTGSKWHLDKVKEHFKQHGVDWSVLWTRVETIVCLTLLSIAPQVPAVPQCFELYGFDILFDDDFKPWLLEVNFSPALAVEGNVDERVKPALMRDLISTLHVEPFPDANKPPTPSEGGSPTDTAPPPPEPSPPPAAPKTVAGKAPAKAPVPKPAAKSAGARGRDSAKAPAPGARGSSFTRKSSSTGSTLSSAAAAAPRPAAAVEYVDRPEGKFKWCFPFNAETQAASNDLSRNPDVALKAAVAEVKKREAKAAAAMKDFAAKYRESTQPKAKVAPAAAPAAAPATGAAAAGPGSDSDYD